MNIFLSRNNESFGPYSQEELLSHLRGGTVLQTDLAWWEGAPGWAPVASLPFVPKSNLPPPVPGQAQTASTIQNSKVSRFAVFSLLLSIFSIIPLAGSTSFLGIICGHIAVSRVKARKTKGKAIAWVAVGLGYFGLLIFINSLVTLVPFILKEAEKQAQQAMPQSPTTQDASPSGTAEQQAANKIVDLTNKAQILWQLAAHAGLDAITTGDRTFGWPADWGAKTSDEFFEKLRSGGYVSIEDLEKLFPGGFCVVNVSSDDPGETLFLASRNLEPDLTIQNIAPFGPYAILVNKSGEVRAFHSSEKDALAKFVKLPNRWPRALP